MLQLIELLAASSVALGVSEMARQTGIPKSSCFGLMVTLEEAGYVRRNERQEWSLTLRIYHVGLEAAENTDIHAAAQPVLAELCAATGLTSHLGIIDGGAMRYAVKVEPPSGMVKFDTYPGKPASAHLTAIGRAIAAAMSEEELSAFLDSYEFGGGHNSKIRSRRGMVQEVRRVRERGYALEIEEETADVACIAAPVSHQRPAAIGVAALASQIEGRVDAVAGHVVEAANALSDLLGNPARAIDN